ncbi:hypothetical protein C0J52_23436, partial [Blattella germanica]
SQCLFITTTLTLVKEQNLRGQFEGKFHSVICLIDRGIYEIENFHFINIFLEFLMVVRILF